MTKRVLVTGAAGFIGAFLAKRLLADGWEVVGLDNVNGYYDPGIKEARLAMLREANEAGRFTFMRGDLADAALLENLIEAIVDSNRTRKDFVANEILKRVNVLVEEGVLPSDFDFEAHRELVPMQPGDVPVTYADTSKLERDTGFKPSMPLKEGLRAFAKWYREYYGIGAR